MRPSPAVPRPITSRALLGLLAALAAFCMVLAGSPTATAAGSDAVTLDIDVPDLTQPGTLQTVDVTVTNEGAERALSHLTVDFIPPAGWSSSPDRQELPRSTRIAPGESVSTTFTIRVPSLREGFRQYPFSATVSYKGGDGAGSATARVIATTGSPFENLAAAYNNVGTTTVETADLGRFDGEGNSFSREQLAEVGLAPGVSVQAVGTTFTWPDTVAGDPDNVAAAGQAISVEGSGSALGFLASGSSTTASGSVTIHYTDGTTSTGTLGVPNWSFQDPNTFGATLVASTMGRNLPTGYGNAEYAYRVFANTVPLEQGKDISFVVLPGDGSIHVFDMQVIA